MRKTIASWSELCDFIRNAKNDGKHLTLEPISWYGEMKTDRKTKKLKSTVDESKVCSITFEVTEGPVA